MVNPTPNVTSDKLDSITSIITSLRDGGWLPVSEKRSPYKINLYPALQENLIEDGYKQTTSSLEEHNGREYFVIRRRVSNKILATDDPDDLIKFYRHKIYPEILEHLVRMCHTHVYKITVERPEIYGYVPPYVWMYTESFGIPLIS